MVVEDCGGWFCVGRSGGGGDGCGGMIESSTESEDSTESCSVSLPLLVVTMKFLEWKDSNSALRCARPLFWH